MIPDIILSLIVIILVEMLRFVLTSVLGGIIYDVCKPALWRLYILFRKR